MTAPAVSVGTLAGVFLRLGLTSFGGPAAHIALLEAEIVRQRKWLSREEFLDLLGATNLIPGPNSTEMAIHIGARLRGTVGLIVAGVCFILPAAIIVGFLAWVYVRFGSLPESLAVLHAVKPVIVVIVARALWSLGRTCLHSTALGFVAGAAGVALLLNVHELLVLLIAGFGCAMIRSRARLCLAILPLPVLASMPTFSLSGLFLFFLKVGSVLFGSGYVLLAFLRADLVERWGWLTETQLIDAVAIGQVTPGPLFTTATFIGYILAGPSGAVVATVGIFLPAFIFVAISAPWIPRLRRSRVAGAFLDGVNAASLALMVVVTLDLGRAALVTMNDWLMMGLAAVLLATGRISPTTLILGSAAIGLMRWFLT